MPERDPESELSDFTKDFNAFILMNYIFFRIRFTRNLFKMLNNII